MLIREIDLNRELFNSIKLFVVSVIKKQLYLSNPQVQNLFIVENVFEIKNQEEVLDNLKDKTELNSLTKWCVLLVVRIQLYLLDQLVQNLFIVENALNQKNYKMIIDKPVLRKFSGQMKEQVKNLLKDLEIEKDHIEQIRECIPQCAKLAIKK